VLEALLLQALALQAAGEPGQVRPALEESLLLAAPEGFLRLFLDEGDPLRALLGEYDHIGYAQKILEGFRHPGPFEPHAPRPAELVETLSERELEVLALIAQGKTNRQIAGQLVIAPGTVKAHTASIYRKLDVNNRTEAAARARQLGLLS
jgi:LuxR family maltose regulon positive regulatory protein